MSALSFNPNCGACGGLNSRGYCSYTACRFPVTKVTVITNQQSNADRFRAMSDEELAEKIGDSIDCEVCKMMHHSENGECPSRPHQSCVDFWLDWLKQEVSSDIN